MNENKELRVGRLMESRDKKLNQLLIVLLCIMSILVVFIFIYKFNDFNNEESPDYVQVLASEPKKSTNSVSSDLTKYLASHSVGREPSIESIEDYNKFEFFVPVEEKEPAKIIYIYESTLDLRQSKSVVNDLKESPMNEESLYNGLNTYENELAKISLSLEEEVSIVSLDRYYREHLNYFKELNDELSKEDKLILWLSYFDLRGDISKSSDFEILNLYEEGSVEKRYVEEALVLDLISENELLEEGYFSKERELKFETDILELYNNLFIDSELIDEKLEFDKEIDEQV